MKKFLALLIFISLFSGDLVMAAGFTCELVCFRAHPDFVSNGVTGFDVQIVTHAERVYSLRGTRQEAYEDIVNTCREKGYNNVVSSFTLTSYSNRILRWDNVLKSVIEPSLKRDCYE